MNTPWQPYVSVIIPVRESQKHIGLLLGSLLCQDYPNYEIVLVGNTGDRTFDNLPDDPKIRIFEVTLPENWVGRDANFKRNEGVRACNGDVLFFTDVKILHPIDWISTGIKIMERENIESVAGIMLATTEVSKSFMGKFTDYALIKRNPEFGKGYVLTTQNFGARESLPITATWAMTRLAYDKMGAFPDNFRDSYEDYASAWLMVSAGQPIYCTNELKVWHKHRTKFSEIRREYARSARGAAQLYHIYPACPFAQRRAKQVTLIFSLIGIALALGLLAILFGQWFLLSMMAGTVALGYLTAGGANVVKARHWFGMFFPILTTFFIFLFAIHFVRKLIEGGDLPLGNNFLQHSMLSL